MTGNRLWSVGACALAIAIAVLAGCNTNPGGAGDGGNGGADDVGPPDTLPFQPDENREDGAVRLTHGDAPASNQNACFSPDGSFIVFTRFENGYNSGPAHLCRLDLDGSDPVVLTGGDQDDVNVPYGAFDPLTGRVVFASDREDANDLWVVDPDSDDPTPQRLTNHGELPVWIEPVFSPDGGALAFEQTEGADEESQRSSVWRIDAPWTTPAQLTNEGGELDDRLPSWSPDGDRILFQRRVPPSDLWEACIIAADGGSVTSISDRVAKTSPGHDTDLSWHPNGEWVASSTDPDGIPVPNIYLLPVDGGSMRRVTESDDLEDGAPCVSPNGRWIAFESHRTADEESPSDLWMVRSPL